MSKRAAIVCLGCIAFIATLSLGLSQSLRAEPDSSAPLPADASVPGVPSSPAQPQSDTVTITIVVFPAAKATVTWGKQRLGVIAPRSALSVRRPRDSGPLDLVIRANGYLAVQTRAYTFADGKLAVKLTPVDQKATLLGYREELPEGGLDAGMFGLPYDPDAGVTTDATTGATTWGGDY